MLFSNISDVLRAISVSSAQLDHVNDTEVINSEQETKKVLAAIEKSTKKIKRETNYITETKHTPPATPEFIKHLNILY
jgi:hypothetical protein